MLYNFTNSTILQKGICADLLSLPIVEKIFLGYRMLYSFQSHKYCIPPKEAFYLVLCLGHLVVIQEKRSIDTCDYKNLKFNQMTPAVFPKKGPQFSVHIY